MIKKFFSGILISVFLTCSNVTLVNAAANSTNVKTDVKVETQKNSIIVNVNGKVIPLNNTKPYLDSNSKLMLPLIPIAKEFDSNAIVDLKDGHVSVKVNNNNIKFSTNNGEITVNGNYITLSVKPIINEGEVFVPLQFFSEILGELVDFDANTNIVKIYNTRKNSEEYFNKSPFFTTDKIIATKLDGYLTALQKSDNFHGSVLVSKGDTILLNKGYSMANFEQDIKNTSQTTFPIGSMTKQFTAMAIMQLVEKGMINEEDKLSKYIPDFPNGNDITIHQLLTHTSGLVIFNQLPEFLNTKPEDLRNINNVIALFKNKPLNFKPGTKFEYCNSGYLLLGYIVEKVSKMSYEDYLKTNIFKPLNMNNTGIAYKGSEKMYNSNGYIGHLDITPISDELILDGVHGAGALYSTTEDIYRWNKALNTETLVNKKTKEKIFSKYVKMPMSKSASYGYGWMIDDGAYGHEIYHGGNVFGFTSNLKKYTDKDLNIIILTNSGYYDIESLTKVLADISLGNNYKMPKEKKETKVDSKILSNYAGKYSVDQIGTIDIINEGDKLYYEINGQKFQIFSETQNKFFFKIVNAEIVFNTDSKANVIDIEIYQYAQKFKGTKLK